MLRFFWRYVLLYFFLTFYQWAELSLCSSHDFQSLFNIQKNIDSAFSNLPQMRI